MMHHNTMGKRIASSGRIIPPLANLCNMKKIPQMTKVPNTPKVIKLPILKKRLFIEEFLYIRIIIGRIKNGTSI